MLTSAGMLQGRNRATEAGFAAYLTKPVKQSELLDAIVAAFAPAEHAGPARRRLARHTPAAARTGAAGARGRRQRREPASGRRHARAPRSRGAVAPNGRDAVARAAEQAFDVVLMDVQMPEMDGLEATMAIREGEAAPARHVPIVAMTAHAMNGDRERCLQAGMDAYVPKSCPGPTNCSRRSTA